MLFQSPVYSKASGSIAGITYSHNRGGMYARARATPTDPSSGRQQIIRGIMSFLSSYWIDTLSQLQRDAWNQYGDNVDMTNRLGETIKLSGQQHFLRSNVGCVQAGIAVNPTAPTIFNLGTYTPPTISEANADEEIDVAFNAADPWAIADGGFLLVYVGSPQSPGIGYFKGPWRYGGKVVGAVIPPTSPEEIESPFVLNIDQKLWLKCRVVQVDGRVSNPIYLGPETVVAGA